MSPSTRYARVVVRTFPLTVHLMRVAFFAAVLAAACTPSAAAAVGAPELAAWAFAAIASALLFFAVFSLFHDCAHGALELPTAANDVVLFLTSAVLLFSAHGQRQLHLRHHARPLAADDMEGEGALMHLVVAALTGPIASMRMRVAGFRAVNARVRPWVVAENALDVAVVLAALSANNAALDVALAVAVALQLTMNAWASHVPHRAPRWLLAGAAKLSWTHSPVVLSLVYHLEHHAHPRVPCMYLKPDLSLASPLLEQHAVTARPWAQLQLETRPRPRTRV